VTASARSGPVSISISRKLQYCIKGGGPWQARTGCFLGGWSRLKEREWEREYLHRAHSIGKGKNVYCKETEGREEHEGVAAPSQEPSAKTQPKVSRLGEKAEKKKRGK